MRKPKTFITPDKWFNSTTTVKPTKCSLIVIIDLRKTGTPCWLRCFTVVMLVKNRFWHTTLIESYLQWLITFVWGKRLSQKCHEEKSYIGCMRWAAYSKYFCCFVVIILFKGLFDTTHRIIKEYIHISLSLWNIWYAISVSFLRAYKMIVKVLSFLPVFAVNSWNRLWALGRLIALSCVWIYSLGIQFVFGFYH